MCFFIVQVNSGVMDFIDTGVDTNWNRATSDIRIGSIVIHELMHVHQIHRANQIMTQAPMNN